jgi:uncharacterized protein (DUF362 family)
MAKARVVVVKTSPATVVEDYIRAMERAGCREVLKTSAPTILKDNISWHFPFPGANTTPWQLEGAVLGLRQLGARELVCVQNKTVVTDAHKGERLNHYVSVFEKYAIPVLYNFKPSDMRWVDYKPKARMRVLPHIYPEGIRIPDYFHGKNIVHLPTVKTHIYTTTTGSMKNAFGGLLNTRRHYTHSVIHDTLVDLLAIQKEIHPSVITLMDGTTSGSGPGPRTMTPHEKDVILVSTDSVAIDAIAAKMMGFDPMSLRFIAHAHEDKLGCGDPREIEVVGEDISRVNWGFSVGNNGASRVGNVMWFGPMKSIQKLFFHTPLVSLFVLGSYLYHDYVWWPLNGKTIFNAWRATKWGKLFDQYERTTPEWKFPAEVEV